MAVGSGDDERSLEETPTWAVTVVCSAFVIISLVIEQAIHRVGTWLFTRHKKALYDAIENLKAELMLMGFISLLLTVGQKPISKICISEGLAYSMLPCHKKEAPATGSDHCSKQMRRWKAWEKEIATLEYQFSHVPARFTSTQQTLFVRSHISFWSRTPIFKWVVCFFRQFFRSIRKVDYLTLRHGFIVAHFSANSKFDFHKYIKRSLDDDFRRVIGISVPLWAFAMFILLINVYKWHSFFWVSFVPLAMVLIVGMKLQLIILEMALEIQGSHALVEGIPVVQLTNKLFWFGRPKLIMLLIHFILFQNAFELAFFLWIWWQFGLASCFHDRVIMRIVIGVFVQFICSYVTLPLYALVIQMGSQMKNTIFEEPIANGLRRWYQRAKKNKNSKSGSSSGGGARSAEITPSHGSSGLHLMRTYSSMGDIENSDISSRCSHSEYEATEAPECSEATKQHPISKQVETSNLEIVASSASPPQPTSTVLMTERG